MSGKSIPMSYSCFVYNGIRRLDVRFEAEPIGVVSGISARDAVYPELELWQTACVHGPRATVTGDEVDDAHRVNNQKFEIVDFDPDIHHRHSAPGSADKHPPWLPRAQTAERCFANKNPVTSGVQDYTPRLRRLNRIEHERSTGHRTIPYPTLSLSSLITLAYSIRTLTNTTSRSSLLSVFLAQSLP